MYTFARPSQGYVRKHKVSLSLTFITQRLYVTQHIEVLLLSLYTTALLVNSVCATKIYLDAYV